MALTPTLVGGGCMESRPVLMCYRLKAFHQIGKKLEKSIDEAVCTSRAR